MAKIKSIRAYEIIDSSGNPTVEAGMVLDNGVEVITSIPSGISVGKYEAVEVRDGDKTRFDGMGVQQVVSYINDLIAPKLVGVSPVKQQQVDYWLIKADGTKNKARLGANTTLTISQLFAKAAAKDLGIPLFRYINQLYGELFKTKINLEKIPTPIFNLINGGKHANNNLDFQEFQIVPSSSYPFAKSFQMGVEIFHELKRVLEYRNANISLGDEGGFAPNLLTNVDAIEVLIETVKQRNLRVGLEVFIGLDIAASHFYKEERYLVKDKSNPLKVDAYFEFIKNLVKNYTLLVLEDPLNQDDWEGWVKLNQIVAKETYLVGDDLLATNKERLKKAIKDRACSSINIKLNQIGTVTETLEVIDLAYKNSFNYIISQRSSETNDDFIADFAVGVQASFVKFGAPARGERVAKYNRLLQIERDELKTYK
jgi:enolase